jgi:hypothetical protein
LKKEIFFTGIVNNLITGYVIKGEFGYNFNIGLSSEGNVNLDELAEQIYASIPEALPPQKSIKEPKKPHHLKPILESIDFFDLMDNMLERNGYERTDFAKRAQKQEEKLVNQETFEETKSSDLTYRELIDLANDNPTAALISLIDKLNDTGLFDEYCDCGCMDGEDDE